MPDSWWRYVHVVSSFFLRLRFVYNSRKTCNTSPPPRLPSAFFLALALPIIKIYFSYITISPRQQPPQSVFPDSHSSPTLSLSKQIPNGHTFSNSPPNGHTFSNSPPHPLTSPSLRPFIPPSLLPSILPSLRPSLAPSLPPFPASLLTAHTFAAKFVVKLCRLHCL
jgi:hypothetical protein